MSPKESIEAQIKVLSERLQTVPERIMVEGKPVYNRPYFSLKGKIKNLQQQLVRLSRNTNHYNWLAQ